MHVMHVSRGMRTKDSHRLLPRFREQYFFYEWIGGLVGGYQGIDSMRKRRTGRLLMCDLVRAKQAHDLVLVDHAGDARRA